MKIAFQELSLEGKKQFAEAELALRMLAAVQPLESVDAIASSDMNEIAFFEPDIVIPLHMFVPKLFDAFTVGCIWEPVSRIKRKSTWDRIKSYDGYGISTSEQGQLIKALKFKSHQPYLLSKIYPSTNTTVFRKPESFHKPIYIGSGWFKGRHGELFSSAPNISVYGPKKSWRHLDENIYFGEIPIDGKSALEIYHKSGIGLSLHHDQHNFEGIPSMRPFEIAASGSVMISDHNAFVQEAFGDNALYLDTSLEPVEIKDHLDELINWIKSHKHQAQEMAEASHKIFVENYSLEILLSNLICDIDKFTNNKITRAEKPLPEVEIIVRANGEHKEKLFRALNSVEAQTYNMTSCLLIYSGVAEDLASLQQEVQEKLPELKIKYINANKECDHESLFYTGLRACTAPYIGFLNEDEVLFSNHVSVLLDSMSKYPDAPLAYSGSISAWEEETPPEGKQVRELAYFYELDKNSEFRSCMSSNAYIVRRKMIPWNVLNQPAPITHKKDDYIFLYMLYKTKPYFLFVDKVTCSFYRRASNRKDSAFENNSRTTSVKIHEAFLYLSDTIINDENQKENTPPVSLHVNSSILFARIFSIVRNNAAFILEKLKYAVNKPRV